MCDNPDLFGAEMKNGNMDQCSYLLKLIQTYCNIFFIKTN